MTNDPPGSSQIAPDQAGEHEASTAIARWPETDSTGSRARLCRGCGTSLSGKRPQAQYCSDRCRSRARRTTIQRRITAALRRLEHAVKNLRDELEVADRVPPEADR